MRLGATPLSSALSQAMGHTLRTGRPAVETVAPEGLFQYLSTHHQEAAIFDRAMTSKSQRQINAILRAYDFSAFGSIADIGGGRGHLLRAVLDSAPSATGVLFDRRRGRVPDIREALVAGRGFLQASAPGM